MSDIPSMRDRLEPIAPNEVLETAISASLAISAKRQADALEDIAKSLNRLTRAEYRGAILTQARR